MNSFYGGRKGISFVIVQRFDGLDIPQKPGEEVYVGNYYAKDDENDIFLIENGAPIVRTPENEKDYVWEFHYHNGDRVQEDLDITFPIQLARGMKQCFEQGAETTREVGYGEYVIIDTVQNYHNYSHLDNGKVYRRGMDYQAELGGAEYIGQIIGPQGPTPTIDMDLTSVIEEDENSHTAYYEEQNFGMVSGKEYDYIKYSWVGLRDVFGNVTGVKLGFTFPYTVIEFVAERVDAYTDPEFTRLTEDSEEFGPGDDSKPFYYKWKVTIPEGVHGTDSKNFRIEDAADGKGDALWYSEIDYSKKFPKLTDIEIAPYKVIDEVTLADDGTFKVDYTYDEPLVLEKLIRWIKKNNDTNGIDLADNGTITINYNTGENVEYEKALTWITDASLADDGKFQILFNNDKVNKIDKVIKWVNSIGISADGTVTYYYNNDTTEVFENVLTWMTEFSLEETGELKVGFNNNSTIQNIDKILKWIRTVEIADDGTITYHYNTGEVALEKEKFLKVISNIDIDTGAAEGDGSQKVVVEYNTGEKEEIGNGLNYIIETKITDEPSTRNYSVGAYHLLVLYADPDKRGNVSYPSDVFGEVRNDWVDLGYIRGEAGGLRIIGNFDSISKLQDADGQWLPPTEVEGWTEERAGWSYTIDGKAIYSYDYLNNRWYSIGDLTLAEPDEIIIIDTETNGKPSSLDSVLHNKGLWLVAEPIKFAE